MIHYCCPSAGMALVLLMQGSFVMQKNTSGHIWLDSVMGRVKANDSYSLLWEISLHIKSFRPCGGSSTHARTHARVHTHTGTHTHTNTHRRTHTSTHWHTLAHTHTGTHTHTHATHRSSCLSCPGSRHGPWAQWQTGQSSLKLSCWLTQADQCVTLT